MSRRSLLLVAFSFASLTLAACSDTTAPTPSAKNQLAPAGQVNPNAAVPLRPAPTAPAEMGGAAPTPAPAGKKP